MVDEETQNNAGYHKKIIASKISNNKCPRYTTGMVELCKQRERLTRIMYEEIRDEIRDAIRPEKR